MAPDRVEEIVLVVSEVLQVDAEYNGERILLDSVEPPLAIVVHIAEIVGAIGTLYGAGKGTVNVAKRLYEKITGHFPERHMQISLGSNSPDGLHVRYPIDPNTSDAAIQAIATDITRKVNGDGRIRFLFEEGWYTYEEYRERVDDGVR